ncbi:MFS transporter [Pseudomonas sp. LB3P38]|uniref:MFS transporter n=1 Tax=Pseudomonas lyxosi TaxID=3398358 RepID=UPI0039F02207
MKFATASSARHSPSARRAIIATVIGNGLEWYDFTVYGFFSVIIAKVFFPSDSELTSYLLALATFGVGFFMRPVGGVLLGIYGDKLGRKAALTATIALMALGTLIIAVAPTYAQIGVAAPILIVVARLLQGFSAGGETGTATSFLIQYAPPGRKTYYSSLVQVSSGVAILLGSVTGFVLSTCLSSEQLESWGWRVPFIIGTLIAPVGWYIRRQIDEMPLPGAGHENHSPLAEVLREYRKEVLISFALVVLWTVCTYAILFYIPSYASRILGMPTWMGFTGAMVAALMMVVVTPIVGKLADLHGRRPFLLGSALATLICAYPLFLMINVWNGLASLVLFELVFGMLIGIYMGPILAAMSELLPNHVRSTGMSLAFNLAVTIFGGFAGFTITWLISSTGSNLTPALYIMFAESVSLIGAIYYREADQPSVSYVKCGVYK